MRHRKSGRKLKRTASHRKATLIALATALIRNKKIKTTVAKAKETRMFVEKILTRAKNAVATEGEKKNIHARRLVARYIKDRSVIKELFGEIAQKIASRPGGYTRVVKLGQRQGDGAEVAILELIDYNTGEAPAKAKQDKEKKKKEKEKAKKEKKFAPGAVTDMP
ncbi:MAG: 50S ribosomal protein L17 [Ignavibacteriae bacterium]|nr:50S ribosomal protein L17 [Ignavibacteria bacterium]MBI3364458.1 50S ribosomal protein L17 [Ignavibacteriota bacterium]